MPNYRRVIGAQRFPKSLQSQCQLTASLSTCTRSKRTCITEYTSIALPLRDCCSMPEPAGYQWTSIKAPAVLGWQLKLMSWLSGTWVFGIIVRLFSKQSGIPQARLHCACICRNEACVNLWAAVPGRATVQYMVHFDAGGCQPALVIQRKQAQNCCKRI
jgi:hypothetical protein